MAIAVVGLSFLLGNHRRTDPTLDGDEGAHFSYLVALEHGHLPAWGDLLDQDSLRLEDCTGVLGRTTQDCAVNTRDPHTFPAGGFDYEAQQPPLGYLPYLVGFSSNVTDLKHAIARDRAAGVIWTALAALLLVGVAAMERLSLAALAAVLSTCLLGPLHVLATSTITNDAPGVAVGVSALLVLLVAKRMPRLWARLTLGLATGLVITMVKGVFLVVPLAFVIAAFVLERPWSRERSSVRAMLIRHSCGLSMFAGSLLGFGGWLEIQNMRAKVPSKQVIFALLNWRQAKHFQPKEIFYGIRESASLLIPAYTKAPLHVIWDFSLVGVVVGVLFLKTRSDVTWSTRSSAVGIVLATIGLAIAWPVDWYFQGHYAGPYVARFALPMLPLIALVVVQSVRRFGLVMFALVFPLSAAIWQLVQNRF